MARRWNLHINQGETWQLTIPVTPADPEQTISGYAARGQVRGDVPGVVLHEWSAENGNITVTADSVVLNVSAAASSAWAWRRGMWDLELTDPGGATTRLIQGWVYVTPEITRSDV